MFKKKYYYHVVYIYKGEGGSGTASTTLTTDKEMNTGERIEEVSECLRKLKGKKTIIITFYSRLKGGIK